jgi:hypothetical protein
MTLLSYLCLFLAPIIYVINIRRVHIFCEINLPNQMTNLIKFLIPEPSELTVRTLVIFYSFLLTILMCKLAFNFVTMLLFLLF